MFTEAGSYWRARGLHLYVHEAAASSSVVAVEVVEMAVVVVEVVDASESRELESLISRQRSLLVRSLCSDRPSVCGAIIVSLPPLLLLLYTSSLGSPGPLDTALAILPACLRHAKERHAMLAERGINEKRNGSNEENSGRDEAKFMHMKLTLYEKGRGEEYKRDMRECNLRAEKVLESRKASVPTRSVGRESLSKSGEFIKVCISLRLCKIAFPVDQMLQLHDAHRARAPAAFRGPSRYCFLCRIACLPSPPYERQQPRRALHPLIAAVLCAPALPCQIPVYNDRHDGGHDVVYSYGDHDVVYSYGDHDVVYSYGDHDVVYSYGDHDVVYSYGDHDVVYNRLLPRSSTTRCIIVPTIPMSKAGLY
ncbi:hypothetical protein FHG87_015027 [Trinorchestia longiramus]|nr:hypothetical protein FHG87_015027 [Trinorchestia longiramus]